MNATVRELAITFAAGVAFSVAVDGDWWLTTGQIPQVQPLLVLSAVGGAAIPIVRSIRFKAEWKRVQDAHQASRHDRI